MAGVDVRDDAHVDGEAVSNLPEDEREPFLASLRSLAEAGWSEAFLALAPVASRCIMGKPRPDASIVQLYNPDDGIAYKHLRVEDESPSDRAAMREERTARMERELAEARRKRERCHNALGDDPDVYMRWLEQALIQQPPGFFVAMLDDPRMVLTETGADDDSRRRVALYRALLGEIDDPSGRRGRIERQIVAFDPARASLVELNGECHFEPSAKRKTLRSVLKRDAILNRNPEVFTPASPTLVASPTKVFEQPEIKLLESPVSVAQRLDFDVPPLAL